MKKILGIKKKYFLHLLMICILIFPVLIFSACESTVQNIASVPQEEIPAQSTGKESEEIEVSLSTVKKDITPETSSEQPNETTYSDDNIMLEYPSEWTVEKIQGEDGSRVNLFAPDRKDNPVFRFDRGEAWRVNLEYSEKDYQNLLLENYPDIEIIELSKTTIDGCNANKLIATYSDNDQKYTMVQYITIVGPAFAEFSAYYPAEAETEYAEVISSIISSVKFAAMNENKDNRANIEKLIENFSKSWFEGNIDTLKQYLSESYAGDIDVYYKPENKDEVVINALKGLDNINESTIDCVIWLEFKEFEADDTYKYLTMELIKEGTDWKVQFYAMEL
jgi:hypothetical protein